MESYLNILIIVCKVFANIQRNSIKAYENFSLIVNIFHSVSLINWTYYLRKLHALNSMEKLNRRVLPPIFKFSDLWNILPFYGYLHKWKLLLEWLSKQTQLIWENCEHEFMSKGNEFKSELRF